MPDNLATIREVIAQHRLIRQQVGRVGDTVNDVETLFDLQRAHSNWAQSSLETLPEKQKRLAEMMGLLDAGLRKHFDFEERALPPILGDVLMRSLVLVHRGLLEETGKVRAAAVAKKLEGLSQEELLAMKSGLQRMTGDISRRIEEHASHEEMILNMAREALEAEAQ